MRAMTIPAVIIMLTTIGAAPAAAARNGPRPGAAGIGDTYFPDSGNGGYDVQHYDIRLGYDPAKDGLSGTTTISARSTQDLSRFNLDFLLRVDAVRVDGRRAAFTRSGTHELEVTPDRPVRAGRWFTVAVDYADTPSTVRDANGSTAWHRTADGALVVGQPKSAGWWFPSNDHPSDKATFDVSVQVPEGTEVISNGVLVPQMRRPPDGRTDWHWQTRSPMATYLAFFAAGQYDLVSTTTPDGQPVVTAFSTELGTLDTAARASLGRTSEIIAWESGLLGRYPFEAQGGLVAPPNTLTFALENATRPVYSSAFWRLGTGVSVVVHELAHQWFGDAVSLSRWRDIWLNEGFATYMTWMWSEHSGTGTAQQFFDYTYDFYPATSSFWNVLPGDPGPDRLFDAAVYDRGAMAVHQIRLAMGDTAFLRLLRNWSGWRGNRTGTTEQFKALAELISCRDLDAVLQTWLYSPGRPTYERTVAPTPDPTESTDPMGASGAPAASAPRSTARIGPSTSAGLTVGPQVGAPVRPAAWDEVRQIHNGLS